MNKFWSSYGNSYLRHLESSRKEKDILTMHTQSQQELLSVLEAISLYVTHTSYGKAKVSIQIGKIDISIESSKEMSS